MSLLLSQGHVEASDYPLWYLGQEAGVARRRIDQSYRTTAIVLQTAIGASKSKKGLQIFQKLLEMLK